VARKWARGSRSSARAGAAAQVTLGEWWGGLAAGIPAFYKPLLQSELSASGEAGGWSEEGVSTPWGTGKESEPQSNYRNSHRWTDIHACTQTHARTWDTNTRALGEDAHSEIP
jgi:hypothetical protein